MTNTSIKDQLNLLLDFATKEGSIPVKVDIIHNTVFMYINDGVDRGGSLPYITEASISMDWDEVAFESTWDRNRN